MKRFYPILIFGLLLLVACTEAEPTPTAVPAAPTGTPAPPPTDVPPTAEPATAVPATVAATPSDPAAPTAAPATGQFPPAQVINDEGGPTLIQGQVEYTAVFFTLGVAQPLVILEDQTGFVTRNEEYLIPVASQTLGQITTDFFTSPFTYTLALPAAPQGGITDVDNDGEADTGVRVFAVAYWNNVFGDPYLEERDLFGAAWSTAYASTRISEDSALEREVVGGKLIIFAPDDQQGFPSGFGEDGLLFTEDDPIVSIPQGYAVVDLESEPFTFNRARTQTLDLIEPSGAALDDYSELSYADAFDAFVDQLSKEYSFTEYKGIDWEALRAEFLPRFAEADSRNSSDLYLRALRDFAWRIPDAHVSGPFLSDEFRDNVIGGIGIALAELSDGRVLVDFLTEEGAAEAAGIELGSEIVSLNGLPINDAIAAAVPWEGPFSTSHNYRLNRLRYVTRFPLDIDVTVAYMNPGSSVVQTAAFTTDVELDSFFASFDEDPRDGFHLPVQTTLLESGFVHVEILSFSDNSLLTVQLWERMIRGLIDNEIPGVIIDMRNNGGGSGFLADAMAAYFFQEPLVLGNSAAYDDDEDAFVFAEEPETFFLPPAELRYDGDLVVIVGPSCISACEFFSYDMTLDNRATIVGHYPTAGAGGGVTQVKLPEDEFFQFTVGRSVDADGNIHIEGIGVVPDVRVPVTEESIFGDRDVLLQTAVSILDN